MKEEKWSYFTLCLVYYCHHHFQLFVELNELITDKDQEMRWKERARWIKFEEDVEEETDRWGKPHVASLSFRSLLELRRTITQGKWRPPNQRQYRQRSLIIVQSEMFFRSHCSPGAILLDLEQNTMPGIANVVVETLITSDQIGVEDRANVLRALLLKHRSATRHESHRLYTTGGRTAGIQFQRVKFLLC